ncbi:MAG: hypothetical protein V4709_03935 [Pseudomonadota bacterium]
MRNAPLLHAFCISVLAAIASNPAHAIRVIDPIFPGPSQSPPAEPRNPCFGGFYGPAGQDAQFDQIGGTPAHDFYAVYVSEGPQYLAFTAAVTDNSNTLPLLSRYEARFTAEDSIDTYFVRIESRNVQGSAVQSLIGRFEVGLYKGRADGLGSEERIVRPIADPGFFYGNSTTLSDGGVISFDLPKSELEALVPGRGFDLGQSLRNVRFLSHSAASLTQPADTARHPAYRLRFDQNCSARR